MADLLDLAKFCDGLLSHGGPLVIGNRAAINAAVAIVDDLVESTPTDTGTALSNWQITLDQPAEDMRPAFVPSPKGKMVKGVWVHKVDPLATMQANAPGVIEQLNDVISAKQPGQSIFISNNVPYIQRLNEGSSEQAPSGFVERAEILAEQAIRNTLVL
jgi:hypothetical protein